jgi:hypothetical protein
VSHAAVRCIPNNSVTSGLRNRCKYVHKFNCVHTVHCWTYIVIKYNIEQNTVIKYEPTKYSYTIWTNKIHLLKLIFWFLIFYVFYVFRPQVFMFRKVYLHVNHPVPYHNCMYNRVAEVEPSASKHVADIKKLIIKTWNKVHFVGLYCTVILQSTVQTKLNNAQCFRTWDLYLKHLRPVSIH